MKFHILSDLHIEFADYDAAQCIANHSEQPHRVLGEIEKVVFAEADSDGELRFAEEPEANAPIALSLLGGFRDGIKYAQIATDR